MSAPRVLTVAELQRQGVLLVEDGNHGEYRPRKEEFGVDGTSFIRAADMDAGRVLFDEAQKINSTALRRITKGVGAPGDILLSHKGTVGKIASVPLDAPPFVCSPQTTFWRTLDVDVLDRSYLHAFLSEAFGIRVAAIVEGCTDGVPDEHGRRTPWLDRKEAYLAHLLEASDDILLVSACDKLHNARAIVSDIRAVGSSVFERFTASREQIIWYYRSLAGVFSRRLTKPQLVRALEYEVQNMTDFGVGGGATAL